MSEKFLSGMKNSKQTNKERTIKAGSLLIVSYTPLEILFESFQLYTLILFLEMFRDLDNNL